MNEIDRPEDSHSIFDRRPTVAYSSPISLDKGTFTISRSGASLINFVPNSNQKHVGNNLSYSTEFLRERNNISDKKQQNTDYLTKELNKEYPEFCKISLENILNEKIAKECLEVIYIASIYVTNNLFLFEDETSEELQNLLEFINQLSPLPAEVKSNCMKKAKRIKFPNYILNINIKEAEDLTPCDPDGSSDPFCKIWMNKEKEQLKVTSIKKHTLTPVWNERFSLPINDITTDIFNIEVWDKDPRGILAALGEFKNVKGFRRFRLFCRDCCQNMCSCCTGTVDDFMGRISRHVNEIFPHGDDFPALKDKKCLNNVGGRLHFSTDFTVLRAKHVSDVLKRHLILFKICFDNSLKQNMASNLIISHWGQLLTSDAFTLMSQHRIQSGLSFSEDIICRLIVLVDVTLDKYPIDYKFQYNVFEESYEHMQQLCVNDIMENSLLDLYKETADSIANICITILNTFHSIELTDEKKYDEIELVLKCIRVSHNVTGDDLPWTILKLDAITWFNQIAKEMDNIDHKLKNSFLIETINFIISFHTDADKVLNKIFPDQTYTLLTFEALDFTLCEGFQSHAAMISEESTKYTGEAKERKIKDCLDFLVMLKRLDEYICKTLNMLQSGQKLTNFRDWFGMTAVKEWFKCKQDVIERKVKPKIMSDNLENMIIEYAGRLEKQSFSVKFTTTIIETELVEVWKNLSHPKNTQYDDIFLETLHHTCMRYAEFLLDLIHSRKLSSNYRTTGKVELCTIANNIWSLAIFVKKTTKDTVQNVSQDSYNTPFALKIICRILCADMSREFEKEMANKIKKVVKAGSQKKQSKAITAYKSTMSQLLKDAVSIMAFEIYLLFLQEIWIIIINIVGFYKTLHKDMKTATLVNIWKFCCQTPNIFAGLLSILKETEKLSLVDLDENIKLLILSDTYTVLKNELEKLIKGS